MADAKKKALGRGLGALIGPSSESLATQPPPAPATPDTLEDGSRLLELNPKAIKPNPHQPRKSFDEAGLAELADSIRRDGVQEPVVVRERNGAYELVSGERRVRASVLAERQLIPAVCRSVSDEDMLRLGIIENIQREDLNAIELAQAYEELTVTFSWTQDELAQQVGKKRVTVTNTLRLLGLPEDVQQHVLSGDLTAGHARALLALESPHEQRKGCRAVIEQGLSVRQTEKLSAKTPAKKAPPATVRDPHVEQVEEELRSRFGTRVHLRTGDNNRGKIEIEFYNLDDLERILAMLRS